MLRSCHRHQCQDNIHSRLYKKFQRSQWQSKLYGAFSILAWRSVYRNIHPVKHDVRAR